MIIKLTINNGYIIDSEGNTTLNYTYDDWDVCALPRERMIIITCNGVSNGAYYSCSGDIDGNTGIVTISHKNPREDIHKNISKIPIGNIDGQLLLYDYTDARMRNIVFKNNEEVKHLKNKCFFTEIHKDPNDIYTIPIDSTLITDGEYVVNNDNTITVSNANWVYTCISDSVYNTGHIFTLDSNPNNIDITKGESIYTNSNKIIHIWFNDNYPRNCMHVYNDVVNSINNSIPVIHTTNTHFLRGRYMTLGYKIIIHPFIGKDFELNLGLRTETGKLLKYSSNLEYLILNGELNTCSRKVASY